MEKVTRFLQTYKDKKLEAWEVFFKDEDGNAQTLANLEIKVSDRTKIIETINEEDYSDGPLIDPKCKSEYWVFGKIVKGKELCIKIIVGWHEEQVICVSFGASANKMNYPYKNTIAA